MFKPNNRVKFGNMQGIILTNAGSKVDFPIQAIFAKQKIVMCFKADGYFFDFGAGPKLELVKGSLFTKGLQYVSKLLRKTRQMDSDKSQP